MMEVVDISDETTIPPIPDPTVSYNPTYKAVAGVALSSGRVVYIQDGKALYYDPMNVDLYGLLIGVTMTSAAYLNPIEVQLSGAFYESGLGLTAGSDYYVGLNGSLILNPIGLKIVQPLGSSIDTNTLNININSPIETL